MKDPTIKEFKDLAQELEIGLNKEFCSNSNCNARFENFRQGQTNLRPRLGVYCGFIPNNVMVNFKINMKTVARRISKVKQILDSKMANCQSISGHRVTPGAFSRGKYRCTIVHKLHLQLCGFF